jgi:glutamine synthetase
MALDYLDKDRAFLKVGGVFTDDLIDAYIELKMKDVTRLRYPASDRARCTAVCEFLS